MEFQNVLLLILLSASGFVSGQWIAAGHIGNRPYSSWYETHFLIRKRGLARWICFSPKHFGRYTLFEVLAFFGSCLQIVLTGVLVLLACSGKLPDPVAVLIAGFWFALCFAGEFFIVVLNDIGSFKDEKKKFYPESGEREVVQFSKADFSPPSHSKSDRYLNKIIMQIWASTQNPYYTIHNLRMSYITEMNKKKHGPEQKEKVNRRYIEYFRNIEKLSVTEEKKDGTLVLKIRE